MDVKESMSRIESAANALNAIADREHSVIRGFEIFLRNANVGVPANALINQEYGGPMVLGYGRVFNKWRIFWRRDPTITAMPLIDAPREVRIALSRHLPLLLEEIVRAAETQLQQAEKEAEEAEKFVASLGVNLEPPPPPPKVSGVEDRVRAQVLNEDTPSPKPKPPRGYVAEEGDGTVPKPKPRTGYVIEEGTMPEPPKVSGVEDRPRSRPLPEGYKD